MKKNSNVSDIIDKRLNCKLNEFSPYSVPQPEYRIKLDGNESPFSIPKELSAKLTEHLDSIEINRYPDPEAKKLRNMISIASDFPVDGILLGNGSDELIEMMVSAFTGGTGRVMYPVPTFSMFRLCSLAYGAEVLEVDTDGNFDLDEELMINTMDERDPDLIFLASPNNPTGNSFSEKKIISVIDHSNSIVVVDEAYVDFNDLTFLPLVEKYENLVIFRTFSKIGFAGIRLGVLLGRTEIVREINKIRLPYNINSHTQRIAELVMENYEFVNENVQLIKKEREQIFEILSGLDRVSPFPSDANFILFRVSDADSVFERLIEKGILIRNFNSPGRLENCLRVTIGKPEENEAFASALSNIVSS